MTNVIDSSFAFGIIMSLTNVVWSYCLLLYRKRLNIRERELLSRQKTLAKWEWSLEQRESHLHKAGF